MRNSNAICYGSYKVGDRFHVPAPSELDFESPREVVEDRHLTTEEKRAVLASWASDACAIDGAPSLRRRPGNWQIVHIDEILEALRALDEQAGENGSSWVRRQVRRASIEAFRGRLASGMVGCRPDKSESCGLGQTV